ncbi:hypothetical protein F5Y03DRAFT_213179 [Xylaria venustula]|nr:hypothetical protein F5Y03DRAFT_213179 [Xylaria venustula]
MAHNIQRSLEIGEHYVGQLERMFGELGLEEGRVDDPDEVVEFMDIDARLEANDSFETGCVNTSISTTEPMNMDQVDDVYLVNAKPEQAGNTSSTAYHNFISQKSNSFLNKEIRSKSQFERRPNHCSEIQFEKKAVRKRRLPGIDSLSNRLIGNDTIGTFVSNCEKTLPH